MEQLPNNEQVHFSGEANICGKQLFLLCDLCG